MRVAVKYSVVVDDEFRRALAAYRGHDGLATRQEVKDHFRDNGFSVYDDVLEEYRKVQESTEG